MTLKLTPRYPVSTNLKQHFKGFVGPESLKKLGYEVTNTTTASNSDLISGTKTTSDSGLRYNTENILPTSSAMYPSQSQLTLEIIARYPISTSKIKRLDQNLKQQLQVNDFIGPGSLRTMISWKFVVIPLKAATHSKFSRVITTTTTTTIFNGFVGPGSIAVTLKLTARYPVSTNLKQHFNGFVGPESLKKLGLSLIHI